MLRDELGIEAAQAMLGHKHIDTTEQYYGHYDLSDLEAAMERHAKDRDGRMA